MDVERVLLDSDMNMSKLPVTLIAATTSKLGIGINGQLPWQLKSEIQYFARVTTRVPPSPEGASPSRPIRNAVIMGRNTWMSIPPKFRPLKNRLNIVLSRAAPSTDSHHVVSHNDVMWASSLEDALQRLQNLNAVSTESAQDDVGVLRIAQAFIIGGAQVYRDALESGSADSVLLTRVYGEWECDAFFPIDLDQDSAWERKSFEMLREFTGEELTEGNVKEGAVEFEYRLYCRKS